MPSRVSNTDLIDQQTEQVTVAEKAKAFRAELEALLTKAKAASQEYTAEKYTKLVKQWEEQDAQIAALIHTLVCKYPCWRCIIECYVCPLLDDMRSVAEARDEAPLWELWAKAAVNLTN